MHFRGGFPSAGGHRRVRDLLNDSFAALDERFAEGRKLLYLLHGEGEPSLQIRIEICLLIEIDRDMQQRAGWCNLNMVRAATGDDRLEAIEQSRQIRAPDVPPVDDAKRKDQPLPHHGRSRCE